MDRRQPCGFSRADLCVVVLALAVLGGLLVMSLARVRDGDGGYYRVACINNQKEITLAMTLYATSKGKMPSSLSYYVDNDGKYTLGWVEGLMSQLGRPDLAAGTMSPSVLRANPPDIALIVCPSDYKKVGATNAPLSYVVNGGSFKHWHDDGSFDCLDHGAWPCETNTSGATGTTTVEYLAKHAKGTKYTIALGENLDARSYIPSSPRADYEMSLLWDPSAPLKFNEDAGRGKLDNAHARPSSNHPGGAVIAFCDGHVEFISDAIDYKVYATLMATSSLAGKISNKLGPPSELDGFFVWPLDPSMIPTK